MKENLRVKRHLAAAAVLTLVLTGCGDGPSQAGSAATLGDKRITTTDLDELAQRGLADPNAQQAVGTDKASFERVVLRRLIEHEILAHAAAKEKVTVTAGEALDARTRIADQLGGEEALKTEALKAGISMPDLEQTVRDVALRDALADKLTADVLVPDDALQQLYLENINRYDKVRSAHILVASNRLAQELLRQVQKTPSRFPALAAKHSTDTSNKDRGGDLDFQSRGVLAKEFEDAIFNNKPGSFVVAKTEFGFHVIRVQERRTVRFEQAKIDLRRQLLSQQRNETVQLRLVETAKQLDVKVNPRFGTWDPQKLDVVPLSGGNPVTTPSARPGDEPFAEPGPLP